MTGRVVVVAFDGAEPDLLKAMIAEGTMPTFERLVAAGRYFKLKDIQDVMTSASWPTLICGAEVQQHLQIHDRQFDRDHYRLVDVAADAIRYPPFWRYASDAGLSTTTAGIYGAPLLESFRGMQVIGWGTHDPFTAKREMQPKSDPPHLIAELESRFGRRTISQDIDIPKTRQDMIGFRDGCLRGIDQQARVLRWLLEESDWDLFVGAFSHAHQGGHFLWHFDDPFSHDDAALRDREMGGSVRRLYQAIDDGIAMLIQGLPEDTTIVVVSPYGMWGNSHVHSALPDVLERGGWFERLNNIPDRRLRAMQRGRRLLHHLVPERARPRLGKLVPRNRWISELAYADVDWSRTRAFTVPSDGSGYIRFNLSGREPSGIVNPDAYDDLCTEITEALIELRDVDGGGPVVEKIVKTSEIIGGPVAGPLPDMCVSFRPGRPIDRIRSDRVGTLEVARTDPRSATHKPEGFMVATGPDIVPSGDRLTGPTAGLVDVAPTVLNRLGLQAPEQLAGRAVDVTGAHSAPKVEEK